MTFGSGKVSRGLRNQIPPDFKLHEVTERGD